MEARAFSVVAPQFWNPLPEELFPSPPSWPFANRQGLNMFLFHIVFVCCVIVCPLCLCSSALALVVALLQNVIILFCLKNIVLYILSIFNVSHLEHLR